MGVFIISTNYIVGHETNILAYNILLFIIYMIIIALAVMEAKEREKVLKVQERAKALETHLENLEVMLSVVRKEKHDFSNHINTIYAISYMKNDDALDKIKMYISNLSDNVKEAYHFYDTGNSFIDSMLSVKSSVAYDRGIKLEVIIDEKLNNLDINPTDLISIVSNIIDNAFEALRECDIENKKVSFYSSLEDDRVCISIANNGPRIPDDIKHKIFESGFSTKTDKKEDHGFGLYIVKQLVIKNNGIIELNSDEIETEFVLKLYKEEEDEESS
jgi:sensor histidine kinase regulating citrate/malate metabolism